MFFLSEHTCAFMCVMLLYVLMKPIIKLNMDYLLAICYGH